MDLETLLKEYIIIVIIITKIINKILFDYLYILVKDLPKEPKNWKEF
jgi:hypothetical protein